MSVSFICNVCEQPAPFSQSAILCKSVEIRNALQHGDTVLLCEKCYQRVHELLTKPKTSIVGEVADDATARRMISFATLGTAAVLQGRVPKSNIEDTSEHENETEEKASNSSATVPAPELDPKEAQRKLVHHYLDELYQNDKMRVSRRQLTEAILMSLNGNTNGEISNVTGLSITTIKKYAREGYPAWAMQHVISPAVIEKPTEEQSAQEKSVAPSEEQVSVEKQNEKPEEAKPEDKPTEKPVAKAGLTLNGKPIKMVPSIVRDGRTAMLAANTKPTDWEAMSQKQKVLYLARKKTPVSEIASELGILPKAVRSVINSQFDRQLSQTTRKFPNTPVSTISALAKAGWDIKSISDECKTDLPVVKKVLDNLYGV